MRYNRSSLAKTLVSIISKRSSELNTIIRYWTIIYLLLLLWSILPITRFTQSNSDGSTPHICTVFTHASLFNKPFGNIRSWPINYHMQRRAMSSICSSNSEKLASELLDNIEDMFLRYYMHVFSRWTVPHILPLFKWCMHL